MAYAAGLLNPTSVKGIVALSSYVPQKSGLPLKLQQLNGFQVFISHGVYDELIPVHLARESADLLRRGGAEVLYREYYMGHEVREETLLDLAPWMKKLIS
jgi:phospholipase/carboxylesterase